MYTVIGPEAKSSFEQLFYNTEHKIQMKKDLIFAHPDTFPLN